MKEDMNDKEHDKMSDATQANGRPIPLKEVVKPKFAFKQSYRDANFFSKMTYHFAGTIISQINKNGGKMKDEYMLDMCLKDNETQEYTDTFKKQIRLRVDKWVKKNPGKDEHQAPWKTIVRNALWSTFWADFVLASASALIAESVTVSYVYFLKYLFAFLKDPNLSATTGVWYVCVYSFAVLFSTFFRNYYMYLGYVIAIRLRKAVVSAMYDKVGNLSTKSLTETNSGKLITIISGDIFNVERAICILPILPTSPIITLLCMGYIWWGSGWEYAIYTLVIWLACIGGQAIVNHFTKVLKAKEAVLSDQRMKLINDLVAGIRTVKSYAWENHYLQKIKKVRRA